MALLVPVLLWWESGRLVDRMGRDIGEAISSAVAAIPRNSPPAAWWMGLAPLVDEDPVPDAKALDPETPAPEASAGSPAIIPARARPPRGLRVSAPTVLRLAQRGARPTAVLVPANGERPAGLSLQGVSGLGVGLQDGDVLTHVGGQPAKSLDSVIAAASAAYKAHVPAMGGRVWRKGESLQLLVELPYPEGGKAEAPRKTGARSSATPGQPSGVRN